MELRGKWTEAFRWLREIGFVDVKNDWGSIGADPIVASIVPCRLQYLVQEPKGNMVSWPFEELVVP